MEQARQSYFERLNRRVEAICKSPAGWGEVTLLIRGHELRDHFRVMTSDTLDHRQSAMGNQ